jgi:ABC-type Mn2+/Zn2+ transport system permease subunit
MLINEFSQNLIVGVLIGTISGLVGSFVILRRMALVGDAMSHIALPGIAAALALSLDPFWGALVFLLIAGVAVWWLEGKTKLPAEAIVGILFTASLAIGILAIPDAEVLESLFGQFRTLSLTEFFVLPAAAIFVAAAIVLIFRQLILYSLSHELASLSKKIKYFNLIFFLVFALVVAMGIKLVGTLLMGALTIIPASIARNLSGGIVSYALLSAVLGGIISLGGVLISWQFGILPGPTTILLGIVFFGVSFFIRKI